VEGWLIEIAVYGTEVVELRSATGQGIQAALARRRVARDTAQGDRNNSSGKRDLRNVRHIPTPEMDELGVSPDINAIHLGSPRHLWRIVQMAEVRPWESAAV
jgi:hypothetical protein